MFGFGKNKKADFNESEMGASEPLIRVQAMPDIKKTEIENKSLGGIVSTGFASSRGEAVQESSGVNKRKIIIIGSAVAVLLLFASGVTYYYVQLARQEANQRQLVDASKTVSTAATSTMANTTSTAQETATSTSAEPGFAEITSTSTPVVAQPQKTNDVAFLTTREFTLGVDTDLDQLSDKEESVFGTLLDKGDTDSDSFPDGWEIVNLYDPANGSGVKLDKAESIIFYANAIFKYNLLVPRLFVITAKDPLKPTDLTFTSTSGEYVTLQVVENPKNFSVKSWLQEKYGSEVARVTLMPFTTKSGRSGYTTTDGLNKYFIGDGYIYIWRYEFGDSKDVNFRQTWEMMSASFIFDLPKTPPVDSITPEPATENTTSTPENNSASVLE